MTLKTSDISNPKSKLCPKCKSPLFKLVGFDKTKGEVYKKCLNCGHSETEKEKTIQGRPAFVAGEPTSFGMER